MHGQTKTMIRLSPAVLILVTSILPAYDCSAEIIFNDGNSHILDVEVHDEVRIRNSSHVELTSTIEYACDDCPLFSELVRVEDQSSLALSGGRITTGRQGRNVTHAIVTVDDAHFLSQSGTVDSDAHGSVASLRMLNNSTTVLIDGHFEADGTHRDSAGIWLSDNASARMFGGSVSGQGKDFGSGLILQGNSSFQFYGGHIQPELTMFGILGSISDNTSLEVRGGRLLVDESVIVHHGLRASGNGRLEISDGVVESRNSERLESIVYLDETSRAVITGGSFIVDWTQEESPAGILALDRSKVFMSGGNIDHLNGRINETDFLAMDTSEVVLAGMNFNFPFDVPLARTSGTVTGNWMSGEPIEFDFVLRDNATLTLVEGVLGDYSGDLRISMLDLDVLNNAIHLGSDGRQFDLNHDGVVDEEDREFWVSEIGNTYIGDSNFDGEFNSADFVQVFVAGEYNDGELLNSTWVTGDWNGDFEFDSSDFVLAFQAWRYEQGPRLTTVPEPSPPVILSVALLIAVHHVGSRIRQ